MNRSFLVLGITLATALPAKADLVHKIQSSISLQVGGSVTTAERSVPRSQSAEAG